MSETTKSVYEQIEAWTETKVDGVQNSEGNLWTSNERLRSEAVKPHIDYAKDSLPDAIDELAEAGEIVTWHGLLAPADDDHLRAIIENEMESGITRSMVVGRCNQLRGGD